MLKVIGYFPRLLGLGFAFLTRGVGGVLNIRRSTSASLGAGEVALV
jgi:hypothetical protein